MADQQYNPGRLLYGGDYNPEQWPREVWAEDIELMRSARINTVSIGIFSWAMLEPREGEYEAGWLDEIIDQLHDAGIGFFLATPTASPPPWFTRVHPDALPVRSDGTQLSHGSRDTYAISAPAYRAASRSIARFLAERYGHHPGLRGWHVHNEYGTIDYGPHAAVAFRRWLRAKYGTLDDLNTAWTTAFWSQRYSDWEDVLPPRATQYLHNPAQAVDFKRFNSDEMLAAFSEQKAEIEASGSHAPVTTNFMLPTWNHLEQWSWSAAQDAVSIDHYLDTDGPDGETHVAYGADLTRSWAHGPWLLMEQNATGIRMGDRTILKEPDRMIRNSLGYIARGSQSSLFFQWRASAGGSEFWHGALVPHAGGSSRAFDAVIELGGILEAISEVAEPPVDGRLIESDVAIVWDAEGWWSTETPHLPNDALSYSEEVRATHRAFWRSGVSVDFVRAGDDVSRYRLVIVPSMFAMSEDAAAWASAYVTSGGQLVVQFFSGVADLNQSVITGGYPGRLRELLGVRVEEIRPLHDGETVELSGALQGELWSERVHSEGAVPVAEYSAGTLAGMPAVTRNTVGAGTATYLSTRLTQQSRDAFYAALCDELGIAEVLPGASALGVEAVRRRGARGDYLFLLHHGTAPVTVSGAGDELISGTTIGPETDAFSLPPGSVAVIRESSREWTLEEEQVLHQT
ncbi:beta-galactosidase [Microbacterium sp. MPKO10]|uniref:beta-galactosidase n=1 Tax=Microbacterium sp. MPKO10 TaxID=2989818 RepID=UPI002235C733|nr:beta-galactosidase [Microbacterium sp. MPKO10]MCW4456995.1 beta-galactosidase [Microbacterium sp. MPKO10]